MKYSLLLRNLFFSSLLMVVFSACKKDRTVVYVEDKKPVITSPDVWSSNILPTDEVEILKKELKPAAENRAFYCDGYTWRVLYINSSLQFLVPGKGWKDENGNAVTGEIQVEVNSIDKPGKNIMYNKPTQTDAALLRTGGSYSISFSKDGEPVTNDGYYYANIPGINREAYSLFEASDGTNWKEINDDVSKRDDSPWTDSSQGLDSARFFMKDTLFRIKCKYKWVNCDFYYSFPQEKMTLKVALPDSFGNKNTSLNVVDMVNNVITNLRGDAADKLFKTPSGYEFPTGVQVTLVSVSKIGTKYYYAEKEITTAKDKTEELIPIEKTKQEVMDLLDGL